MRARTILAVLAVLGGGGAWAWSKWGPKEVPPTWRTATVERQDVRQIVSATGPLQAVQTVEVGAQVSGIVASLGADFNDRVTAGQVLARIDPALLEADVASAAARLAEARASEDRLGVALQRLERVPATATTADEVDAARAELAMARAQVEAAEVALSRARRNLGYATIKAPIDGTVVRRDVEVGQTVNAGFSAPKLFLLAGDLTKMHILAAVDESDIGRIREGQPATFTVQSFPDREFSGTVKQVRLQSATVESVVTYTVVVSVENTDNALLPGMTATVSFEVARVEDTLCVTNAALRYRPDDTIAVVGAEAGEGAGGGAGAAAASGAAAAGATAAAGAAAGAAAAAGATAAAAGAAAASGAGLPAAAGSTASPATGGGERGGGRGRRGKGGDADAGTLWVAEGEALRALPVKVGLRGATCVEVSGDGVAEGVVVVTGVERADPSAAATSPLGAPAKSGRPF